MGAAPLWERCLVGAAPSPRIVVAIHSARGRASHSLGLGDSARGRASHSLGLGDSARGRASHRQMANRGSGDPPLWERRPRRESSWRPIRPEAGLPQGANLGGQPFGPGAGLPQSRPWRFGPRAGLPQTDGESWERRPSSVGAAPSPRIVVPTHSARGGPPTGGDSWWPSLRPGDGPPTGCESWWPTLRPEGGPPTVSALAIRPGGGPPTNYILSMRETMHGRQIKWPPRTAHRLLPSRPLPGHPRK